MCLHFMINATILCITLNAMKSLDHVECLKTPCLTQSKQAFLKLARQHTITGFNTLIIKIKPEMLRINY